MASCNPNGSPFDCTLATCCREQGFVDYEPGLASTVAYLAIFALFGIIQLGLGIKGKTWGFMVGMVCGLLLEVLGYAGRLMIRSNPFDISIFLFYFIPLGLGPAFLTASIYITLGRLVVIYGEQFSRLRPRTYTYGFVTVDIFSLCIQGVGGGICGSAMTDSFRQQGVDILIAGLTLQACSLLVFLIMCTIYGRQVRKSPKEERNEEFAELREMPRFRFFLVAISVAAIAIFLRCVYRVVELAQGFGGAIANAETPFLIMEGPMIMLAVLMLTIFHPTIVFRGGLWKATQWRGRDKRLAAEKGEISEKKRHSSWFSRGKKGMSSMPEENADIHQVTKVRDITEL